MVAAAALLFLSPHSPPLAQMVAAGATLTRVPAVSFAPARAMRGSDWGTRHLAGVPTSRPARSSAAAMQCFFLAAVSAGLAGSGRLVGGSTLHAAAAFRGSSARRHRGGSVAAFSERRFASDVSADTSALLSLGVLWRFARPHTMIGSFLCVPALICYAAPSGASLLSAPLWLSALYALPPVLLMNLYITGLNQLCDVDIDRINKPTLPLASGELGMRAGAVVVGVALAASLYLGWAHPVYCTPALRATLVGSAVLGTAYSVPPLRLKRFPMLAATCIIGVRGALVNWGFLSHALTVFQAQGSVVTFLPPMVFFSLFGLVIAAVKDVPDVKGDAMFGIRSFSVRFSPKRVLDSAVMLLCGSFCASAAALALGAVTAVTALDAVRRGGMAAGALLTARLIWRRKCTVDAVDRAGVYSFYIWLWRFFYGAYLALPFAR